MSAAAARLLPAAPDSRAARALRGVAPEDALRLATFAGLAAFVCGHWAAMVTDPPIFRMVLVVLVATGVGAALTALPRAGLPRPALHLAALGIALAGAAMALAVAGLPVRLLPPGAWDELRVELDAGLSGIRTVEWPYGGDETWVRLVILLAAPATLVVAAALAFWPARRGRAALRALGLVALLALYGTGVTEHDPGSPLIRGLALFLLVAAWLWLPRLRAKEAAAAAVCVLAVGVLALPAAARLDSESAVIDYKAWNWFGGKDVTFNWNHSYGPLDWSRDGTTLLHVKSSKPLYWKAETLDSFDGLRWTRSPANDRSGAGTELPPRPDPRWDESFGVTVRSLRTDFVIGAGTPYLVTGAGAAVSGSADGTLRKLDQPLERGDDYRVRAYVPDPSAREMRRAEDPVDGDLLQYTRLLLPLEGEDAIRNGPGAGSPPASSVSVPLFGSGVADPDVESELADSEYAGAYRLARRLTAGAQTEYDAVKAVQDHLGVGFIYSERPPSRAYPLEAFLFEDKIGYCQQFSGAMALMLRMAGVPARVVSGFSPGSLNRDTGEFRVRDLDAHSWVEVWFTGIGWVTFDPTPATAPADRGGEDRASGPLGDRPQPGAANSNGTAPNSDGGTGSAAGGGSGGGDGGPPPLILVLAAAGVFAAGIAFMRRRRRRGLGAGDTAEAGIRELERALPRLGWPLPAGITLLQLERRLGRMAGPGAAAYVARLREGRFSPRGARPPGRAARRALRRDLTASRGPLGRLRGFAAIPPRRPV